MTRKHVIMRLDSLVLIGVCAATLRGGAVPDPVEAGADEPRARYLSITPPSSDSVDGEPLAIRVEIISMERFPSFEGEIRWVGAPGVYPLTRDANGGTFRAAPLECDPVYMDWGSVGVLEIFGSEVVPGMVCLGPAHNSIYELRTATAECVAMGMIDCLSAPLQVSTAFFGDTTASNGTEFVGFDDGAAVILSFENVSTASYPTSKPQAQQAPNLVSPFDPITILDIDYWEAGFKCLPFFAPPPLTCPRPFVGCGDCRVDYPEECDDGDVIPGDGCDAMCRLENATMRIWLNPVLPSAPLAVPYPVGTMIDDGAITLPAGGVRVFFELYIADWDPDFDSSIRLRGFQVALSDFPLLQNGQVSIVPATATCDQSGDDCEPLGLGRCENSMASETRCQAGKTDLNLCVAVAFDSHISGVRFASDTGFSSCVPYSDPGFSLLAGHVAYDISDDALGTFELGIRDEYPNTFCYGLAAGNNFSPIGIAEMNGVTITIQNEKSRYLTVPVAQAVAGGEPVAVRVEIIDSAQFAGSVGEVRWAAAPMTVMDCHNTISVAQLQCGPNVLAWDGMTLVHLFGTEVVPEASYEIRTATADCIAMGTVDCMGDPFVVNTGMWGDAVGPWGGPNQPNFADVTAEVDTFKDAPGALSLTRTDLVPAVPNHDVNFADITAGVDAFKGHDYPYAGPGSCP